MSKRMTCVVLGLLLSPAGVSTPAAAERPPPGVEERPAGTAAPTMSAWLDALTRSAGGRVPSELKALILFRLLGEGGGEWRLRLESGRLVIEPGGDGRPDLTIEALATDWTALLRREIAAAAALLAGKIRLQGDLSLALRIADLLGVGPRVAEGLPGPADGAAPSALDRLSMERLGRVHADVQKLRELRSNAPAPPAAVGRYQDYRAILHAHSYLSHDSRGTVAEILQGAREAAVHAIFMTDHYTEDRRFLKEALRGVHDGVLFIPGTELSLGLLAFRIDDVDWPAGASDAEILERLHAKKGLAFIAHPEKRTEWTLPPFAGMEIYNTHADAEDTNSRTLESLRGREALPRWLELISAFRQYPREAFASIFDVPIGNLANWDRLNETRKVVGIAANDSHNNVGVVVQGGESGMLEVWDVLGKKVTEVPASSVPSILFGGLRPTPGQKMMELRLDPYPISFGYVSTHILAEALTVRDLFRALEHGRCYVAFDWLADPTGFAFEGIAGRQRLTMGDTLKRGEGRRLVVTSPMPASLRLLRGGREVARETGTRLEYAPTEPGVYRAEVWVTVAGEERPWIYANPIRVE